MEDTTSGKQANEKECLGRRHVPQKQTISARFASDTSLCLCKPFVLQKIYIVLMSIKRKASNSSGDHAQVVSVQGEVRVNGQQRELFASARHSRAVLYLNANELHDN